MCREPSFLGNFMMIIFYLSGRSRVWVWAGVIWRSFWISSIIIEKFCVKTSHRSAFYFGITGCTSLIISTWILFHFTHSSPSSSSSLAYLGPCLTLAESHLLFSHCLFLNFPSRFCLSWRQIGVRSLVGEKHLEPVAQGPEPLAKKRKNEINKRLFTHTLWRALTSPALPLQMSPLPLCLEQQSHC